MAKTRTPKDDENKFIQDKIQKQYEDVFLEQNTPPTHLSLREVEALKARVAELEAKLEGQSAASVERTTVSAAEFVLPDSELLGAMPAVTEQSPRAQAQKRGGLLRSLLRAPTLEDPAKNRVASLQHKILMGLFITSLLAIVVLLWNWSETTPASLGMLLLAITLFAAASFWQRGGHVEPASWVLIGTIYSVLLFSTVRSGLGASNVIQAAIIISLAGLLLRPFRVVVVTLITLLPLLAVRFINPLDQTTQNQLMFIVLLLGLEGLLLTVASRTLERSFAEADQSTQDLRRTNQALQGLAANLERRVVQRTHDLEVASEVGKTISEKVENLSEMLMGAVEMIRARFNLYYTQVYLVDPAGQTITLRAGTGDAGKELLKRGHHLLMSSDSLNGRAAVEKQSIIVADTKESHSFLPNPLLPKTRSEMTIPLVVGEKVVGVLDMQSEQADALNQTNLPAFETLAGQLAIAIQNAALLAQAEEARTAVEEQVRHLTQKGWQEFLDAIERGQKIGYAFEQSKTVRLQPEALAANDGDFSIPITITGTKIGEIRLPVAQDRAWTNDELELIRATSAQLAQHVENLRLLAQAEKYRSEAEKAVQRLTHEGWDNFLQTHSELESGYTFDLTDVQPLSQKSDDLSGYAIKHPMVVGDQIIGELAVDAPNQSDEAAEVLSAVAEQLSGHIENLRLAELNERHAQREQTLRQITSALRSSNNPATIMRTAVRELGNIMGRRTIVQLADPQQANQAASVTSNENTAGGKE